MEGGKFSQGGGATGKNRAPSAALPSGSRHRNRATEPGERKLAAGPAALVMASSALAPPAHRPPCQRRTRRCHLVRQGVGRMDMFSARPRRRLRWPALAILQALGVSSPSRFIDPAGRRRPSLREIVQGAIRRSVFSFGRRPGPTGRLAWNASSCGRERASDRTGRAPARRRW